MILALTGPMVSLYNIPMTLPQRSRRPTLLFEPDRQDVQEYTTWLSSAPLGILFAMNVAPHLHGGSHHRVALCQTCCMVYHDYYSTRVLDRPKRGRRSIYPWDSWFNGQIWTLRTNRDFPTDAKEFRTSQPQNQAQRRGLFAETHLLPDGNGITLQVHPRVWKSQPLIEAYSHFGHRPYTDNTLHGIVGWEEDWGSTKGPSYSSGPANYGWPERWPKSFWVEEASTLEGSTLDTNEMTRLEYLGFEPVRAPTPPTLEEGVTEDTSPPELCPTCAPHTTEDHYELGCDKKGCPCTTPYGGEEVIPNG